jgi:hypothetical protein
MRLSKTRHGEDVAVLLEAVKARIRAAAKVWA